MGKTSDTWSLLSCRSAPRKRCGTSSCAGLLAQTVQCSRAKSSLFALHKGASRGGLWWYHRCVASRCLWVSCPDTVWLLVLFIFCTGAAVFSYLHALKLHVPLDVGGCWVLNWVLGGGPCLEILVEKTLVSSLCHSHSRALKVNASLQQVGFGGELNCYIIIFFTIQCSELN